MSYDELSVFKLVQYNIIFRLLIRRSVLGYMSNLKRLFFKIRDDYNPKYCEGNIGYYRALHSKPSALCSTV